MGPVELFFIDSDYNQPKGIQNAKKYFFHSSLLVAAVKGLKSTVSVKSSVQNRKRLSDFIP